jgi:hypothetical protein
MGKIVELKVHLYHVQVDDELTIEGGRRDQIKGKIRLDESLDEGQKTQLWDLLEEF